jgi:hypothetical protein
VSRTIYKYQSAVVDDIIHLMPKGAEPLHVAMQNGMLTIWAVVNPEFMFVKHHFTCRGTGNAVLPSEGKSTHLGTVMDGPFVWHVFYHGQYLGGV